MTAVTSHEAARCPQKGIASPKPFHPSPTNPSTRPRIYCTAPAQPSLQTQPSSQTSTMQKIKNVLKGHKAGHTDEYEAHGATAYDSSYETATGATGVTGFHGASGGQSLAEVAAQQQGMAGVAGVSGVNTSATSATEGYTGTEGVVERPVAVGVAEVPVVVTEEERIRGEAERIRGSSTHQARAGAAVEEVCGQKTFTEVEDRPIVKERVERYVEHHPVEKQYVVETKYVGEREVASATGVTHVDAKEYVVEAAEPGPKCPTSAGAMMNEAMGGDRRI